MKHIFYIIIIFISFSCKKSYQPLEVTKSVDLEKYSGKWYEIARFPHSFEKDLKCVTAEYTLNENGKINVLNKGHKKAAPGKVKDAKGTAWIPDKSEPGKLKVSFFWPFAGSYWILKLDENYQYALIGVPSRKYLWILARDKRIDEKIYLELVNTAKTNGFDITKLEKIDHDCL